MFEERWVRNTAWAACIVVALFTVVPFIWIIGTAFKTAAEINAWPPTFLPVAPTLENFVEILGNTPFPRYIANTMLISLVSMACIMVTSSLAGFVFAKYKFPMRGRSSW